MFRQAIGFSFFVFLLSGFVPALSAETSVDFSRHVRPVLSENCFQCHGPDAAKRKAGLRLDTEAGLAGDLGGGRAVVVPKEPDASELIRRIRHPDPQERMPPPSSKKRLGEAEIQRLVRWVEEGAAWERHWAFVAPRRPPLPSVKDDLWARNAIDRFILHRLEKEGLSPSPQASRETLIRRAILDFTGLPPTLDEVESFAGDDRPAAYERLLDRLLQSPRYGEHMAWQWLEAARYADTDGYQNDGPRDMWPWRDWVIESYNRNLPFDRFTIEQLAGDLLPSPAVEQIIATGFNRNNRYNSESGLDFEEFLLENAVDRVDTTSTVWMGLTMGCARCHDHQIRSHLPKGILSTDRLLQQRAGIRAGDQIRQLGASDQSADAAAASAFALLARSQSGGEGRAGTRRVENCFGPKPMGGGRPRSPLRQARRPGRFKPSLRH